MNSTPDPGRDDRGGADKNTVAAEAEQAAAAGTGANIPGGIPRQAFGFSLGSWRNASKEGIWVVGGQVMTAVAGLVGLRILTELASREILGQASLLLGIYAIGRNLFVAPIGNAQIRFHPDYLAQGQAKWFTGQISRATWYGTVGLCIAIAVALSIWKAVDPSVPLGTLLVLSVVVSALDTSKSIRLNRMSAERIRRNPATWASMEAWLTVLCAAGALKLSLTRESYLAGQSLGLFICLGIFGFLLYPRMPSDRNDPPIEGDRSVREKIVKYGLPFVPLAVVSWISNLGDRYLIGGYLGSADVGVYAAAYGLASRPFIMLGGVMSGFARPILFQAESSKDRPRARRVFLLWIAISAAISGLGVLAFFLFGSRLSTLFLSERFRRPDTTSVFVWVGIGYAIYNSIQILENRLLSLGVSRNLLVPALVGAISNVVMNIILIPRHGILGAAEATAASFLLQGAVLGLNFVSSKNGRSRTNELAIHENYEKAK